MIEGRHEDISIWPNHIEAMLSQVDSCCVDRVIVIESTSSTMDASKTYAGNQTGVLIVASEQVNGRGQRGRRWYDGDRCTLPCTFTFHADIHSSRMMSVLMGCAVHETVRSFVPSSRDVRIKWPNDIIIREGITPTHSDRKIAGILIEQDQQVVRVGIGINCSQGEADWESSIQNQSSSMSGVGAQVSRLDIVCGLIERLSSWLKMNDPASVRSYYQSYDAMVGTYRQFIYDGAKYAGVVEHIDPLGLIDVKTLDGIVSLPADQTRHDHASEEDSSSDDVE